MEVSSRSWFDIADRSASFAIVMVISDTKPAGTLAMWLATALAPRAVRCRHRLHWPETANGDSVPLAKR